MRILVSALGRRRGCANAGVAGLGAGICLLINNITGPGVPQLPNLFSEAGWLLPTIVFLAVWVMTALSTSMFCEAMRRIPGNANFTDRIEYTSIIRWVNTCVCVFVCACVRAIAVCAKARGVLLPVFIVWGCARALVLS